MFRMHAIAPLSIGLTSFAAQAGLSPSDFVDPLFASMARSRVLTVDSDVLVARARGDEINGAGASSGNSSTSSPGRWRIADSNGINLFYNRNL